MPRVIILSNPRSGSTYLQELLNCHQEIEIAEEILNDEFGILENPNEVIKATLDDIPKTIVGFKAFPEQIFQHNLHFGELLQTIGATHVIVIWREGILETLASRRIADIDGDWYSTEKRTGIRQIKIEEKDLSGYIAQVYSDWGKIGSQWPVDVRPIFVKFEDLIRQPIVEARRVLAELSCSFEHVNLMSPSERQNPSSVEKKVINFHELPSTLRDSTLNVDKILLEKINTSLQIPKELLQYAPDREPCMPAGGWRYRVAEPYLPALAKQNAFDAIQSGSISSAGYWPREMATSLRSLFRCPVAQPCSNGFTALMLALQAANIGEGDEVILPTMTMVAVPNAVHYLRATPIFADNSLGSYNPSWEEYKNKATEKTKAVIVTHTYGVPVADIEEIANQCKSSGWTLIEDISECVGVTCTTLNGNSRLLGTFGDFSIASLYANKIVHGGDGGFVIAKEAKVGNRLASIVNHGFTPSFHFVHFEQAPNAKIHGIGAAIASGCLQEVDKIMKHRSLLAKWYRENLKDLPSAIKLMPQCGPMDTPWVFGLQCESKDQRTKLRASMAEQQIETRDFFFNLHLQPAYLPEGGKSPPPSLPNAEVLGSTGFYLPTHSNLTEEDVRYICNCLKQYFSQKSNETSREIKLIPSAKPSKWSVQIKPNGFALQVRKYRETGELTGVFSRGHQYITAVKLGNEAEEILFHERYDQVEKLLGDMKQCLMEAEGDPMEETMKEFFQPYLDYFTSQESHLVHHQLQRPWLLIDLASEPFKNSNPTTTDPETLQFLVWLLQKHRPQTVWEIGSWFGHATLLISEVLSNLNVNHKVYACDAFRWQPWMHNYLKDPSAIIQNGKSFLETFKENVKPAQDNIEPVIWPYDICKLPITLKNQKPEFIFLDITQDDEDLEQIWAFIKDNLIPNETVILFNGLTRSSIPFFSRHAKELKPLAKPHTIAKAFRFIDPLSLEKPLETYDEVQDMLRMSVPLKRSLKFHTSPGWDHHHRNLFCRSIDLLKTQLHSDEASVLFIPAVEESLCDEPDLFYENSWIGIIHSVENHPELFYTPDLKGLCTNPRYLAALKNCKGLFTLTSFQANYLRKHLPPTLPKFPIQRLIYPGEAVANLGESLVPNLISSSTTVDLIHVGSFARDFNFFYNFKIPNGFRKCLIAGDEDSQKHSQNAPKDVTILERLTAEEYEEKLKTSVVVLTLKYEGAANTLILECIFRNLPILSPNLSSCTDYLGTDYPLLYDRTKPDEIQNLLSLSKITEAIAYLKAMDKSKFSQENFLKDVEKGAVLVSQSPISNLESLQNQSLSQITEGSPRTFQTYDVTVCICSYKRTHHLSKLLENLWDNQDFSGTYQILIWNNNDERNGTVRHLATKYVQKSNDKKALELISSTENYFCSIRFALPSLMKSKCMLICDDDIIPGENFISFFYSAHEKNPKDVLCVRGHEFLEHQLNNQDPAEVWMNYDSLRFRDDNQPEQFIHFVHADACLIPKMALQEIASVPVPDPTFAMVDDYWMSFVLSHLFKRKLRKLSIGDLKINPIQRTDDSDTPGLALHTRPEVQDARLRLYVHHMTQGWPTWNSSIYSDAAENIFLNLPQKFQNQLTTKKQTFWNETKAQIGFNVHSTIDDEGILDLGEMGVKCVRIGAVGVGGKNFFELSGFLTDPQEQLATLENTVKRLGHAGIDVVITLERRVASEATWRIIAEKFATFENVVGYDLINEPYTEHELGLHWSEVDNDKDELGIATLKNRLLLMIKCIRQVDKFTAIILEPSFWGRFHALPKLPVEDFLAVDSNIVISFHFYEPMTLTSRVRNKGKHSFPGTIPWFNDTKFSEETFWDENAILQRLQNTKNWADEKGVKMFIGEFGICRDIKGAPDYLKAVINSCKKLDMTGLAFSFRDPDWEAMDYELGQNIEAYIKDNQSNNLMAVILDGINSKK